jgi:hypothetical protein
MPNSQRKAEDDVWYVYAPLKNEKRELVTVNPPSNIPYLNGVMDDDAPQPEHTIWFKDTDSDFVRLSKLGGRPGKYFCTNLFIKRCFLT